MDDLISKDRAKKNIKSKSILSFKKNKFKINADSEEQSKEHLIKSKSRRAIRGFRDGLNFGNFAEKTNTFFKNKLSDHGQSQNKQQEKLVSLEPEIWRVKLSKVFKELRGEKIY